MMKDTLGLDLRSLAAMHRCQAVLFRNGGFPEGWKLERTDCNIHYRA